MLKKINRRQISEAIGMHQARNKQYTRKALCGSFHAWLVNTQNTHGFSWTYCGTSEMFNLPKGL